MRHLASCLILLCFFLPSLAPAAELDIYKPYGSWVDQEGALYTANPFKSQIHKFNAEGDLIWTYGTYGSSIDELRAPQGIAINSTGRIYVVDTGNHRIVRLLQDASGPQWDTVVVDDQSLYLPRDIAIDADDHLFVVDAANRVLKFDTSGNPVLSFVNGTSHEYGTGSDYHIPSCQVEYIWNYVFDATTPEGQVTYATVLTGYSTKAPVKVLGTEACFATVSIEELRWIILK